MEPLSNAAPSARNDDRWRLAPLLAIVLAVAATYWRLPSFGFQLGDDMLVVVQNEHIRSFTAENLRWMLTTFLTGHWEPVSWIAYGLIYAVWGLRPAGYHLASLLLHLANALLLYGILLALIRRAADIESSRLLPQARIAAALGALFYALHPLRVEAVAWASCLPYPLAACLMLVAAFAYVRSCEALESARRWWRMGALGAYGLSLAAVPIALPLPLVLIILDWYPLRRLGGDPRAWLADPQRTAVIEKTPWFALMAAFAALTLWGKMHQAEMLRGVLPVLDPERSPAGAVLYGLWLPLWHTLTPRLLAPHYDLPGAFAPASWTFYAAAAALAMLAGVLAGNARRFPAAAASLAAFYVLLAPFIGHREIESSADRYTYIAAMALAALAAAALFAFRRRPRTFKALSVAAAVSVGALAFLSARQIEVWREPLTLVRQLARANPSNLFLQETLGQQLLENGLLEEAIAHYRGVLAVQESPQAMNNLGAALAASGRRDEAAEWFRRAARQWPEHPSAHQNLRRMGLE